MIETIELRLPELSKSIPRRTEHPDEGALYQKDVKWEPISSIDGAQGDYDTMKKSVDSSEVRW